MIANKNLHLEQNKKGIFLFVFCCLLYFGLQTYRLEDFPIYFFCDETFPSLTGEQLYQNKLRGTDGTFLPLYFDAAAGRWTPVLTVYFYGLASYLGGNSIFLSRLVAVFISLFAPIACAFTLRNIFKVRLWWLTPLAFLINPAWLIHSRTIFETICMTSFYAAFILYYLLSRKTSLWYLPLAAICAAAAFYSYSNGQIVVVGTAFFIFITSLHYYFKNFKVLILSSVLALVLAIPLINFRSKHGQKFEEHLKTVDSYLVKNISLDKKIEVFTTNYLNGITPLYWFRANGRDIERHRLPSYAHFSPFLLPFLCIGLLVCIRNIRKIEFRLPLISLFLAPVGGALVEVILLRAIVIIVPVMTISFIGLEWVYSKFKSDLQKILVAFTLALCSGSYVAYLLYQSLWVIPPKYNDYGLYGIQYGAKQLFEDRIPDYLKRYPNATIRLSPVWANGTDAFPKFFLKPEQQLKIVMDSLDRYLMKRAEIQPEDIFIFTESEYQNVISNKKFELIELIESIKYPNGKAGFYVIRFKYSPIADQLLKEEEIERHKLKESKVKSKVFTGTIRYSTLDMGQIENIFDSESNTLIRGYEANPLILELAFSTPRSLKTVYVNANPQQLKFTVKAFDANSKEVGTKSADITKDESKAFREISFDSQIENVATLRIELTDSWALESANVHVWELDFK